MAPGVNIENTIIALMVVVVLIAMLAPAFFGVLPPTIAQQLNNTGINGSTNLQGLIFRPINNTAFCGTPQSCTSQTGGFNTNVGSGPFSGFAFVMQGFGSAMTILVQAPVILGTLAAVLITNTGFSTQVNSTLSNSISGLVSFLFILVGISAIMKFPLRQS